ncbi:MAG: tetratricopeptide repeat protein [Planctomycetes bacterium]|nr:tetratricopeptide repeat protein [Planctomycetota bacterium]
MDPSNRPLLTLAIAVSNANASLRRTLAATHADVDEIVVCDVGEVEIAAGLVGEFGGRYVTQPWCDSEGAAANEAIRHASGRWILVLEPGETVASADLRELRARLAATAPDSAYLMLIKGPPAPGSLDGEQVAQIRLFPNRPGIRFHGRVRASVRPSLEPLAILVEGLPYRIQGDPREQDVAWRSYRARRRIELADLESREVGPRPRLLNCLAASFVELGQTAEGTAYYRRVIDASEGPTHERLEAFYGLLALEDTNADLKRRLAMALEGLKTFPLDMQLLCAMGGLLQVDGQWDLALRAYETAFRFGQIDAEVEHLDGLRSVAAECYALSLQLRGDMSAAQRVLEEALAAEPASDRIRRHLLDVLIKTGQRDAALTMLAVHPPATDCLEALRSAVRGACLAAQRNWLAARAYLQVAYQASCRDPICLRWLAVTLLATQEHDDAAAVLREWQAREPLSGEPGRYLEAIPNGSAAAAPTKSPATAESDRQIRVDPDARDAESLRARASADHGRGPRVPAPQSQSQSQ